MPDIELPVVPLLPLRDVVSFPSTVLPLFIGRTSSLAAVEYAMNHGKTIFLTTQKAADSNNPPINELYKMGTLARVLQVVKGPEKNIKIFVEGLERATIVEQIKNPIFTLVKVKPAKEIPSPASGDVAFSTMLRKSYNDFIATNSNIPRELAQKLAKASSGTLADLITMHLRVSIQERQDVLEELNHEKRCELVLGLLNKQQEIAQLEQKIQARVKKQLEKNNKEYYLHEQINAIRNELGENEDNQAELAKLEERLKEKKMPEETREKIGKELKRLKTMSPMGPETTMLRNYVDLCLDLPWEEYSEDNHNIKKAKTILNKDHYGLEKVKERILEFLAVQALVKEIKGPILCLVGPPGVGKTSLARSIARALGRKFVRLSLGGVRDEATIRGHRRTYIGAMPGRILQSIKRAGTGNPLLLLDEIDKLASDVRGDPASALLEVLDPEVNSTFSDHYLELDYDLSKVLFICTANTLAGIPPALADRMEIIHLPGYTEEEKRSICQTYLLPRQKEAVGLKECKISWPASVSTYIIRNYTKEAGVRTLERTVGTVLRKIALELLDKGDEKALLGPYQVSKEKVRELLGPEKYLEKATEDKCFIGLANGLAWTEVGGTVLPVEVAIMEGSGKLQITGKLGDVMKESAQAAMSYVRSRAALLDLAPDLHSKIDIHIHVPDGATPKDGPSAGITMVTALISALTNLPVRHDVAMTGEITLRGRVLPIGGLKEKSLAAYQVGCKKVIIPQDNVKDLEEIPEKIRQKLTFVPVSNMDEVLQHALIIPKNDPIFHATLALEPSLGIRVTSRLTSQAIGDNGAPFGERAPI